MKVYSYQLFAAAALAVAAFVPAYSAEIPDDDSGSTEESTVPTAVHLDTSPSYLKSFSSNEGESYAVYLYYDKDYSYEAYSASAPMINGGDFYFTTAPENSLESLYFYNSETKAFSSIGSLTFDRLAKLSFANLTGGVIDIDAGGSLTITHVDDGRDDSKNVEVRANKSSTAPVIDARGATVTLANNGNILFSNNISGNQNTAEDRDKDGDLLDDILVSILTGLFSPNWTNEASVAYGGILQGTTVVINNNKSVSFKRNANLFDKSNGGAIYSEELTLAGNGSILFDTNMASDGDGGAIYANSGDVTISDTGGAVTFTGNAATLRGGAIYAGGKKTADGEVTGGNVTISGSEGKVSFSANASLGWGGAISANGVVMDGNASISFEGNKSEFENKHKGSSTTVGGTGGAIDVSSGGLTIRNTTGAVEFSGNYAHLEGGAIAAYKAPVTMENNGSILFKGNTANLLGGGAIYLSSSGSAYDAKCTVTIKGTTTGAVEFIDNSAKLHGGAIYSVGDVILSENKDVTFSGNKIDANSDSNVYGGAIYTNKGNVTISNNNSVTFSKNTAILPDQVGPTGNSRGGAIYAAEGTVTINDNNGAVVFSANAVHAGSSTGGIEGGAIYAKNLNIRNNASVEFRANLEIRPRLTHRLRSLYITGDASLSAAAKNSITFYDSIYIGGNLTLNETYTDAQGKTLLQTGDILFSGENTVADLKAHKGEGYGVYEDEKTHSRTTTVIGDTVLKGGRLRVENEAVFLCDKTITLAAGTGATLLVKDATVRAGAGSSEGHIFVNKGTSVILEGSEADSSVNHARINNQVWLLGGSSDSYSLLNVKGYATIGDKVRMEKFSEMVLDGHLSVKGYVSIGDINSKATINFLLAESHLENAALNVTQNLYFDIGAQLTLGLNLASDAEEGLYRLITDHSANPTAAWVTEQKLTVWGLGAASSASFDDLQWKNGTLYYDLKMLQWTNADGNGLWDTTAMNWQTGRTYTDGRNVKFADDGVGTVFMSGDLDADTVWVTNSTGEYVFTAAGNGGQLAGDTVLVKRGSGTLTLASANAHTGATLLDEGTLNLHHANALGGSVLTAAAGTTLGVGNNAHVVLDQANHSIAGNVLIDAGATLEIKGAAGNGYKASTSSVNGTLIFTETAASIGTLIGSKGTVQVVNSRVTFDSIDDFRGNLNLFSGVSPEKYAQAVFEKDVCIYAGATLSAGHLGVASEPSSDAVRNNAVGGEMALGTDSQLILQYGSTLVLDKAHIRLNDAKLKFYTTGESKINLNLTLDGPLAEDSRVILFSGVVELLYGDFGYDGVISAGSTFSAQEYFTGDLINEKTLVTFADGVVSLSCLAIPEPSTFGLLAGLGALALVGTRRRRR